MNDIIRKTKNGAIIGATAGAATVTAVFVLAVAGSIYATATDECRHEGCGNTGPLIPIALLVLGGYYGELGLGMGALAGATIGGAIGFTKGCVHYFFNDTGQLNDRLQPPNDQMHLRQ